MDSGPIHHSHDSLKREWRTLDAIGRSAGLTQKEYTRIREIEKELQLLKGGLPKGTDWPEKIHRLLHAKKRQMAVMEIMETLEPDNKDAQDSIRTAVRREISLGHLEPIRNAIGRVSAVILPKGAKLEDRLAVNIYKVRK